MYVNSAARKGYSGTMVMTKIKPISYSTEFEDDEGRVQRLEFDDYYFVNAYFPNSRRDLSRLEFKIKFDRDFEKYIGRLEAKKPVLVCGDFNVAHKDIDIARPAENRGNAGFTDEEREWMTEFLGGGRLDTFRIFNKGAEHYTWWAYFSHARDRNIGWRIDYFVASKQMRSRIVNAGILSEIRGSDHAPIYVTLKD
jgi:exodeoxyribonuclease III